VWRPVLAIVKSLQYSVTVVRYVVVTNSLQFYQATKFPTSDGSEILASCLIYAWALLECVILYYFLFCYQDITVREIRGR